MRNWKSDIKAESQEQIQFNSFRLQFGAYRYAKKSRKHYPRKWCCSKEKEKESWIKI